MFNAWADRLDSSNYPEDHPLYTTTNKARLGCFKDETAGRDIEEMVCLRPKMFSIRLVDSESGIRGAKGIGRSIVRRLSHLDYRSAYDNANETSVHMTTIRSTNHTIQTVTFKKRALSAWDDKRCWLGPNSSVPHGHYRSGVPLPKRHRPVPPPSGDLFWDRLPQ